MDCRLFAPAAIPLVLRRYMYHLREALAEVVEDPGRDPSNLLPSVRSPSTHLVPTYTPCPRCTSISAHTPPRLNRISSRTLLTFRAPPTLQLSYLCCTLRTLPPYLLPCPCYRVATAHSPVFGQQQGTCCERPSSTGRSSKHTIRTAEKLHSHHRREFGELDRPACRRGRSPSMVGRRGWRSQRRPSFRQRRRC